MPLSTRGRQAGPTIGNNRKGGSGRTLVACLLVSLALFTVSCRFGDEGPLAAARGAFQTVTLPVRYLGATVAAPFQGLGNIVTNLTADQATLSELRAENEELKARNVELEEAAQSAERLQGLLDLRDANNLQSTAARIISGSGDSWGTTVTIDKGASSGLSVGMPVATSTGVIGQIVECGPATSTVRLVTDDNSSVSAMIQSSRAQGMLVGTVTGQLELTLIGADQSVSQGDVVVTSGLGGVFPKGLPLGEVVSVESSPGAAYLTIVVEPFAHAENYEEVLVITSLTEEQRATAEDIAAADAQDSSSVASRGSSDEGEDGSGADGQSGGSDQDGSAQDGADAGTTGE